MSTVGLITEYNPFHNGHKYHIQQALKTTGADNVVCVMSGNFVQRGEPAIINKWKRAEIALLNGADLVLELPVVFSSASAEYFSFGAVSALHHTGIVDFICFGSESGEIDELAKIADVLVSEPEEFKHILKNHLDSGVSFAKARSNAIAEFLDSDSAALHYSNNILGIEYLKALRKLNSDIKPMTIKRIGAGYNDTEIHSKYSSATAIRKLINNGIMHNDYLSSELHDLVPEEGRDILLNEISNGRTVTLKRFEQLIMGILRKISSYELLNLPYMNEGLDNRFIKAIRDSSSIEEFLELVYTTRYPLSRIRRILIAMLLGISKNDLDFYGSVGAPYLKVLGFNSKGRALLSDIKDKSSLPIITKPAHLKKYTDKKISRAAKIEAISTDIYTLGYETPEKPGAEFYNNPVILL